MKKYRSKISWKETSLWKSYSFSLRLLTKSWLKMMKYSNSLEQPNESKKCLIIFTLLRRIKSTMRKPSVISRFILSKPYLNAISVWPRKSLKVRLIWTKSFPSSKIRNQWTSPPEAISSRFSETLSVNWTLT